MRVVVTEAGYFGMWYYFRGKVIVKVFKVQQLEISEMPPNLTCTNFGQTSSNKVLL